MLVRLPSQLTPLLRVLPPLSNVHSWYLQATMCLSWQSLSMIETRIKLNIH
jgi:hypothetical protein